jgi:hypothetical protein
MIRNLLHPDDTAVHGAVVNARGTDEAAGRDTGGLVALAMGRSATRRPA